MQFDLAKLDILTPSEEGRDLVLVHPLKQTPFTRADGTAVKITMRGRNSSVARAVLRQIGDERAAVEAEGRNVTQDMQDAWNTRYLVAMTVDWNFDTLDGQEFPCHAENAKKLWDDPRFVWLRPRGLIFISEDGNFLGG